jgi:hypothetical protein
MTLDDMKYKEHRLVDVCLEKRNKLYELINVRATEFYNSAVELGYWQGIIRVLEVLDIKEVNI